MQSRISPSLSIPRRLAPHFQEYSFSQLDPVRDANLILQRVLEFGDWEEVRWLFRTYGIRRIRSFLRRHGERSLRPVTFYYWRKLFGIRKWMPSPFQTAKGELWKH